MAEIIFYGSVIIITYIYIGYPFILLVISIFKNQEVIKKQYEPFVSILIAAYNEKEFIDKTLENKLSSNYPKGKYEIIVVSDSSTDGTDEIVKSYEHRGVKLLRQEPRKGKTSALNKGIMQSKGEIIAFSDANSIYNEDALSRLVSNFRDPSVGYVTGKMIYANPDGSLTGDGCSAYMKYENILRLMETRVGSVVGVDGGIDAVRKALYQPMRPDQLPDFVLPLKVVEQGYRVVYEPKAILREASLGSATDEYRMRVRVSLRAFWALKDMSCLLTFKKYALFSWQLWSHKVLRYLSFLFMISIYFGNALLVMSAAVYLYLFVFQTLVYLAALSSPIFKKKMFRPFHMLNYFVLINAAALHAFFMFLFGRKQVMWTPRKG